MNQPIRLLTITVDTDNAGFTRRSEQVVWAGRASLENRHGTSMWVNLAAFSKATAKFRLRSIPGLTVTTDMEIEHASGRYVIDSVEVIGRYVEIFAHQVVPEGHAHG